MISPSDAAFPIDPAVAAKLMQESWRTPTGSVLPLEFKAVNHPLRRKTDWTLDGESTMESEFDSEVGTLREQIATLERRLVTQAQQNTAQLAEARRAAHAAGFAEAEETLDVRVEKERDCIKVTCADFKKDRDQYFAQVEGQVVRLALGIAERVLHREAKLDPLLLGATVRVALDKLAAESTPILHVPANEVEAWRAMLTEESRATVQVIGDERMVPTECLLETNVGRVELGVAVQLAEIEKGFFDLMQLRPS